MKRQNVVPGAFALNYLLGFNNKLHASRTEVAFFFFFLGKTSPVDAAEQRLVPSSSSSLWGWEPMIV